MCLLTILVKNTRPEVVKLAKIANFIENILKIYEKPYPFEFGGGWGLLVFHKYFLVSEKSEKSEQKEMRPL